MWCYWIGKWHLARPNQAARAVCGANLSLIVSERTNPLVVDRCRRCQNAYEKRRSAHE